MDMLQVVLLLREQAIAKLTEMYNSDKATDSFKAAYDKFIETKEDTRNNSQAVDVLVAELERRVLRLR